MPRRFATTVVMVAAPWMAGCGLFLIDHDARALEFCNRNAELLQPGPVDEGRQLNEDQASHEVDELSKTMRYAEDGTREVRSRARDLADAYDDVREIAGDDVPTDELDEKYDELRTQRSEMRSVCADVLAEPGEREP